MNGKYSDQMMRAIGADFQRARWIYHSTINGKFVFPDGSIGTMEGVPDFTDEDERERFACVGTVMMAFSTGTGEQTVKTDAESVYEVAERFRVAMTMEKLAAKGMTIQKQGIGTYKIIIREDKKDDYGWPTMEIVPA